jgi:ferredoxin-NADP reductase
MDRAVFIAGGVGINPIMSMISTLDLVGTSKKLGGMVKDVRILYTSRRGEGSNGQSEEVLFENRLRGIAQRWNGHEQVDLRYSFFETGHLNGRDQQQPGNMVTYHRRMSTEDLFEALGPEDARGNTVVYVCGLPTMTDDFVALLKQAPGMDEKRVLCEKWW